ncbi:MAG: hypothetical protein QXT84_02050 [Candidatus Bathyarchaeia archaeon]
MNETTVIRNLRDIIPTPSGGYERIDFETLTGKEIIIHEILFLKGRFGEYAWLHIELDGGSHHSTITGGSVVMEKLKTIREYLPVKARVVRKRSSSGRRYFDLE